MGNRIFAIAAALMLTLAAAPMPSHAGRLITEVVAEVPVEERVIPDHEMWFAGGEGVSCVFLVRFAPSGRGRVIEPLGCRRDPSQDLMPLEIDLKR